MGRRILNALLSFVPLLLWFGVISALSQQPKLPGFSNETPLGFVWFKTGHLVFYGILSLWAFFAWRRAGEVLQLLKKKDKKHYIILLVLTFVTILILASIDEWHQSMIPGRTARPRDVLIDLLATTLTLIWLGRYNDAVRKDVRPLSFENLRDVAQMARAHAWGA